MKIKIILSIILAILVINLVNLQFLFEEWEMEKETEDLYCYTSQYAQIYYSDPYNPYISYLGSIVDYYFPLLLDDYDIQEKINPVIIIYSDYDEFADALGISEYTNEDLPIGAYQDNIIYLLSPELVYPHTSETEIKKLYRENGVLIHEMSHFLTDIKTGGKCKQWFSEGVAMYFEYKYTGKICGEELTEEQLELLNTQATSITFEELQNNFTELNTYSAYFKSFQYIKMFVDKFGEDALIDIMEIISQE